MILSQTAYSAIITLYHQGNWLLIMNFNIQDIGNKHDHVVIWINFYQPIEYILINILKSLQIYMSCNNLQDPHLLLVRYLKTICQLVGHFQVRCLNKVECWWTIGLIDTMIGFPKTCIDGQDNNFQKSVYDLLVNVNLELTNNTIKKLLKIY